MKHSPFCIDFSRLNCIFIRNFEEGGMPAIEEEAFDPLYRHKKRIRTAHTEAIYPTRSAVRAAGIVWRVFLIPTAPKYTAIA